MHQTSSRHSSSNARRLLIGVGASLGVLLVCLAAWLGYSSAILLMSLPGAIGVAMQEALEPMIVVLDFEGNLAVGNIELAYDLTTEEFQLQQTLEDFARLVKEHPELHGNWVNTALENTPANSCICKITAQTEDGRQSTFELRLLKEEEKWKINEIVFLSEDNQ